MVVLILLLSGLALAETAPEEDLDRLGSEHSCGMGIASGCYNLGVDSFNNKDTSAARQSFKQSCDMKLGIACFQLGKMAENDNDIMSACYYYGLAGENGFGRGTAALKKLKTKMTKVQIDKVMIHLKEHSAP